MTRNPMENEMTDTTAGEVYSLKGEALEMIAALEAEATRQGRGKPTDVPGVRKTIWSAAQRLREVDEAEWWNTTGAAALEALAAQPSAGAQPNAIERTYIQRLKDHHRDLERSGRCSALAHSLQWAIDRATPAQPDTGMAKILRDQGADPSRYLNPSHAAQPDTGDVAALRQAKRAAIMREVKAYGKDPEVGTAQWVNALTSRIITVTK